MSGVALDPARDVGPAPDPDRARREPRRAVRVRALRCAPTSVAPAVAGVVLLAEAAAVVRLVVGVVLLVSLLAAARPTGR